VHTGSVNSNGIFSDTNEGAVQYMLMLLMLMMMLMLINAMQHPQFDDRGIIFTVFQQQLLATRR